MSDDRLQPKDAASAQDAAEPRSGLFGIWESLARAGLGDITLRLGTHVLLVALILVVAWGLRALYQRAQTSGLPRSSVFAAAPPTAESKASPTEAPPEAPDYLPQIAAAAPQGVLRSARLHTDVPSRAREEVIKYTVQQGDTVFGIADKFGLKPETILWANQFVLGDNPHALRPGQELNILPVNGTYHRWSTGDGLNGVAKFFGVSPEDIINYPANLLDPAIIGDLTAPNIQAGAWLVIPGGRREFVNWSAPAIPRENPGVAKVLGPGACGSVADGAIGAGVFIWPADHHYLSGFDYNPSANHSGIDIDGDEGMPVYAVDNGVVVYAGWNNWGYGNVVVINHGNGWQTLYAHLSQYYVSCGQSVYQTNIIGAIGSTGKSSGPHLHFEMMYNGTKVNPHDYLP
jgi:murein DD-endopeptidase MepM/ murein hydrolase activator NlpD